jgi:hypothetical protein
MRKTVLIAVICAVVASLATRTLMSQQRGAGRAVERARRAPVLQPDAQPAAPAEAPAPAAPVPFMGFGNASGNLQIWYQLRQQMWQSIAQKEANQVVPSEAEIGLQVAIGEYLAEAEINRIISELQRFAEGFPDSPASAKAKLALKALTFDNGAREEQFDTPKAKARPAQDPDDKPDVPKQSE